MRTARMASAHSTESKRGLLSALLLIYRHDRERRKGNLPQNFIPKASCTQPTRPLSTCMGRGASCPFPE